MAQTTGQICVYGFVHVLTREIYPGFYLRFQRGWHIFWLITSTGSFSGFCLSLGYRIPCGLFTPGSKHNRLPQPNVGEHSVSVVFANGLVLKNLA